MSENEKGRCMDCGIAIPEGTSVYSYTVSHRSGRQTHTETRYVCRNCFERRENEIKKRRETEYARSVEQGKKRRVWAFVLGALIAAIMVAVFVVLGIKQNNYIFYIVAAVGAAVGFCMSGCFILGNNFLWEVWATVASWGSVRFPGIIFSFSLDGLKFLIFMKLLFAAIAFLLGLAATALATAISGVLSVFVYPYAIVHNIRHPEDH